jgi:hypothetical protein
VRFRIPRSLAHVQVVKHRTGSRVTHIEIRHRVPSGRGSQKRVTGVLEKLGYQVANTSAIGRHNGTARTMSAYQVRKSLTFSRRTGTKLALGWWGVIVYNCCRPHRSLPQPLAQPMGKKVSATFTSDGIRFGRSYFHSQGDPPHSSLSAAGVR